MAINKVNTTAEEQSFKFPKNQSSILYTADTNNITINGVNVIVDEPKRGDVMCITRYKAENVSLPADKQKVIWIDGLSIEPTQLSQEYIPVGVCFAVKGNKAFVRYREEASFEFAAVRRWELPYSSIMNDGTEHTLDIYLDGLVIEGQPSLILTSADTSSRKAFVDKLNAWFLTNNTNYSAELVELYTDLPAVDTSDTKDGDSYRNRVIINAPHDVEEIAIEGIGECIQASIKQIKGTDYCYKNNGFLENNVGGYCRARYYDWVQSSGRKPMTQMTNINVAAGTLGTAVKLVDFTNNSYCQILRDNFANYDEYFDSMMVKYPCGAGGVITEFPSGKENTYKLANCTYLNNKTGKQVTLYPAASWATSISLNAPKLGKGNWWLPSAAEMAQMMRDVTYDTSFWETEPDIVNRVIAKLTSINSGLGILDWAMLSASTNRWTSSLWASSLQTGSEPDTHAYIYQGTLGVLSMSTVGSTALVSPITIYEF